MICHILGEDMGLGFIFYRCKFHTLSPLIAIELLRQYSTFFCFHPSVQHTPRTIAHIWLPTVEQMRILRVSVAILEFCVLFPMCIATGNAFDRGDIRQYKILTSTIYAVTSFYCFLLSAGYWFFGRQMVRIAETSIRNARKDVVSTLNTRKATASNHSADVKIWKSIFKMKVFNYAFMMCFTVSCDLDVTVLRSPKARAETIVVLLAVVRDCTYFLRCPSG